LHFSPKFKLVYSGDTRPSKELEEEGEGADLLIHEATFESQMKEDALKKMHCTVDEAVHVASRMKAMHTILFHFSQRYPKIPILDSFSAIACDDEVEVREEMGKDKEEIDGLVVVDDDDDDPMAIEEITKEMIIEREKETTTKVMQTVISPNVFISFDLMVVKSQDLLNLSAYLHPLVVLLNSIG